jgi:class 3 adenylate cyclase
MAGRPATRYAKSGDVHIGYQVFGDGREDLVYVPTWWSNVDAQWDVPEIAEFLTRLSSFCRVIVFDKRGGGISDPVPLSSLPTLEEWMDDLRAVLDAVGSQRATLFGVLGGGLMCMLFAATYPERVSRLLLLNAYARYVRAPDYPYGAPPEEIPRFIEQFVRQWSGGTPVWEGEPLEAGQRERWARYQRLSASPGTLETLLRMTLELDLRDVVPLVQAPAYVLFAPTPLNDHLATTSEYLAQHLPNAHVIRLFDEPQWALSRRYHISQVNAIQELLTGESALPDDDRVLATVLFTDIVASTEQLATRGDAAWRDLLDGHDKTMGRVVAEHRGRLVKQTGDGILATFDGPARAVRCAVELVRAADEQGITLRAGLHTGEIEHRSGDVTGIAVHIASRIAALAEPKEILVSRTVVDLTTGSELQFGPRGEHELKGVPGTWPTFATQPTI